MNKTAILIVIDAVGIDTLKFLIENYPGKIKIPNLLDLGLSTLIENTYSRNKKNSKKGKLIQIDQISTTADSLIGHREMVGVIDRNSYNLFPDGFPKDYLLKLEKAVGRKTFFNKMAGGMEAIELNYKHHEKTGDLIIYASKCDPLIQIAMNEEIIPLKEQKYIADTAFKLAIEQKLGITRAIARSYIRRNNEIIRTANRYDAVLPLSGKTLIDIMNENFVWTIAVGKTSDLVNTNYYEKIKITNKALIDPSLNIKFVHPAHKDTNPFNMQGIINAFKSSKIIYRPNGSFIFANLVDTDSLYGHTRDIKGAVCAIEEIDRFIGKFIKMITKDDLLIITADHGMQHRQDYGYHNKEKLFAILYPELKNIKTQVMPGLCDIGNILAQFFELEKPYSKLVKDQLEKLNL
ncbi:MAG: alkaline phosphatase family protein [Elusimicrobiota bacterium]